MEENKNNALEKAKNLERGKKKKTSKPKKSSAVKVKSREEKRAEKARIKAEKRVELERIKAHRQAEKEKAKNARKRGLHKLKEQRKAQKEKRKEERLQRKEMLKNESRKDREKRLKEERAERREQKRQRRIERKQIREQKAKEKRERRKQNKGLGGWIVAVVSLGVTTLVLSSVLTYTFLMPSASDNTLEQAYQKSFYDTVERVENMDLSLSKFFATKDDGARQLYLVDTAINAELAELNLSELPLKDESRFYTSKLINQLGDYSKYLNEKLVQGESLSDEQSASLMRLYEANKTLKNYLVEMMSEMGNDFTFANLSEQDNVVLEKFNNLQNLSVEYPELIYDGPFSDGLNDREVKGLNGAMINASQAVDVFNNNFADYNLKNVRAEGETNGYLECYNVQGETNGDILYAQVSKTGGKLVMFSYSGSCMDVVIDQATAIENAGEFIKNQGIDGMKEVWVNFSHNVYTINFAFTQDNVIVYGDLIKVRVCAETGKVIGYEASGYYTNHTDRVIDKAEITEADATKKVSSNIEIDTIRLAVVPFGKESERLCYEFSGTYDGDIYYVYIDASTGRQVELFKVIEDSEGSLLT